MFTSGIPTEFLRNTVLKFQHFFRGQLNDNSQDWFDTKNHKKDFALLIF